MDPDKKVEFLERASRKILKNPFDLLDIKIENKNQLANTQSLIHQIGTSQQALTRFGLLDTLWVVTGWKNKGLGTNNGEDKSEDVEGKDLFKHYSGTTVQQVAESCQWYQEMMPDKSSS